MKTKISFLILIPSLYMVAVLRAASKRPGIREYDFTASDFMNEAEQQAFEAELQKKGSKRKQEWRNPTAEEKESETTQSIQDRHFHQALMRIIEEALGENLADLVEKKLDIESGHRLMPISQREEDFLHYCYSVKLTSEEFELAAPEIRNALCYVKQNDGLLIPFPRDSGSPVFPPILVRSIEAFIASF